MDKVNPTKKIQFTMEVVTDTLEFLGLKLKFDKESKQISVDVFAKDTDSFTYVLPSTCFPKNNIENIPIGVALRHRRICDSDKNFEKHGAEYQNYLVARDYKPGKVKKQFSDIKQLIREEDYTIINFNLIPQYNPLLPNLKIIKRNHLLILCSNQQMLDIFPKKSISVTYKRSKNLREILSPSLFPRTTKQNECSIKECNRKCDICKNFLIASSDFTCFATKRKYKIKGILKCDSRNVIYLISCKCCGKQYVGSVTGFKERFRVHKSDVDTGKVRCGVVNHLLNICRSSASKFEYLQLKLMTTLTKFCGKEKNAGKCTYLRYATVLILMYGML